MLLTIKTGYNKFACFINIFLWIYKTSEAKPIPESISNGFVSPYNICASFFVFVFFSDRLWFRRINEVGFFQEANTAHSLWVQLSGIWIVAPLAVCCSWSLSAFIRSSWRGSLRFPWSPDLRKKTSDCPDICCPAF